MPRRPDDPLPPLTERDRDAAVRRLQEAYAEGHISHEDMDERLHQVLTAHTHGDLAPVLDALPQDEEGRTSSITAHSGRIRRRGAWPVPRTLKVVSAFGRVRLDLSRAVVEHPVIDIELQLGTGNATITVPRDAVVDLEDLRTTWKAPRYRARRRDERTGGPTVRVSGAMQFGRLTVRHARR
ncbi:DUF1707 domain-containing protein [Streptomyces sp. ODS28]|uniref:DUF1707 SHOCT-like domain-containing protein n=1 Tax=Streptomyces sp. ODS28 TaxID=3136688 RepID=UPI0031EB9CAA